MYGDIGNPAGSANPLLVHPATFLLHEDGSWALTRLRWSDWGTSTASATGYSSASDGSPSMTAGVWLSTPARFTLFSPGTVLGHTVYRCLDVAVAAYPKSDVHACLSQVGSLYVYPVVLPAPPTIPGPFSWPTAHVVGAGLDGIVLCTLSPTLASCWSTPPAAPNGETATLAPSGPAAVCITPACGGAIADIAAQPLPIGSRATDGPFECSSGSSGITCEVTKTARGFRFDATSAVLIGP